MSVTPSVLRQNIYKLLDRVLNTGKPLEIHRKGKILKIVPPDKKSKFKSMRKRKGFIGNPENIVHLDWSGEWKA